MLFQMKCVLLTPKGMMIQAEGGQHTDAFVHACQEQLASCEQQARASPDDAIHPKKLENVEQ